MILKSVRDIWPIIHPTARVAENAVILGDVILEEKSSCGYGVLVSGDAAQIVIRAGTTIQDGCQIYSRVGIPTIIGRNVTAGYGAVLHGCTVEDNCFIGMGALLLNGCVIGEGSFVAAGALVAERTVFPSGSMIIGNPAKAVCSVHAKDLAYARADVEGNSGIPKQGAYETRKKKRNHREKA